MTTKTRMAQRFDSAWAQVETEHLTARVRAEMAAAQEFVPEPAQDLLLPKQDEKWGRDD